MGDGNGGASFGGLIKCGLHNLFRVGVQCRGCLVEKKNLGITKESAGNSDTFYESK